MTQTNLHSRKPRHLTARRLTLLASIGALGAAVLLGGPASYWQPTAGALGANAAAESDMQRPVGFADIVAKVKPAVISVRVNTSGSAEPALSQDDGDDEEQQAPIQPGSPLNKFSNNSATSSVSNSAASSGLRRRSDMALPQKVPASLSQQTAMR